MIASSSGKTKYQPHQNMKTRQRPIVFMPPVETKPTRIASMSTLTPITPHDPLGNARSPHWPRVRLRWLVDHPTCEACGRKQMLNVHHVAPFHLHPEKELDPANLVTV